MSQGLRLGLVKGDGLLSLRCNSVKTEGHGALKPKGGNTSRSSKRSKEKAIPKLFL